MVIKILAGLILGISAGILGRMGGAEGYNTRYRDMGCSIVALAALWVLIGFKVSLWWVYLLIFGLHWGSFSTYWDFLFGFDNLWFSGFVAGLSLLPGLWLGLAWWFVLSRTILLGVTWGLLNKYLPQKVLLWRRDVAEEFLRYSLVIVTLLILVV